MSALLARLPKWLRISGAAVAGLFVCSLMIGLVMPDEAPPGAEVEGVGVGGLTGEEAEAELRARLADGVAIGVWLAAGDKVVRLSPADAGLGVDYQASAARAGAGSGADPLRAWRWLFGERSHALVRTVDRAGLERVLAKAASEFETEPLDAEITLDGARIVATPARRGRVLDRQGAAASLESAWRAGEARVSAPIIESDPKITDDETARLVDEFLAPALSAPVTLDVGERSLVVEPAVIAEAIVVESDGDEPTAALDRERAAAALADRLAGLGLAKAADARIVLAEGRPKVVPSVDGESVSPQVAAEALAQGLAERGEGRRVLVEVTKTAPKFTTQAAAALGVKEVTGEFTTYYPHSDYRNNNIGRAAELMNGVLILPGQSFSLNKTLGKRTTENGFVPGWAISGGRMVRQVGGGVSQSATTLFNAVFFAGLRIDEHKPHSLRFSRYPDGREATVNYPDIDLAFTNDTPHGVLLQAWISPSASGRKGQITVRVWSTRVYEVTATDPVRSNQVAPQTIEVTTKPCEPQSASWGYDVDYSRVFSKYGRVVRKEDFFWTYQPANRIRCVDPPKPATEPNG